MRKIYLIYLYIYTLAFISITIYAICFQKSSLIDVLLIIAGYLYIIICTLIFNLLEGIFKD